MRKLLATALFVLALGVPTSAFAEPMTLETLRAARKEAAQRPRRIIFNNDGNEPVILCKGTTAQELLDYRTTGLAGSQVDSLFYCTWASGFGLFTHDTKVGHVFLAKEGLYTGNITDKLLAAGTDPLRVMADFAHQHDMEIIWSLRMNDNHDAGFGGYGPILFAANPLKQQHPEWLIGSPTQKPPYGAWSAMDFAVPEVRDLEVQFVEEICRSYDVDGIELDYFRHPVYFKRAAQAGEPCNDEERSQMTAMMRRIREVTETEGLRRGRPIVVAMRVPDSIEYSRDVGLDIETWLDEGLVDLLIVGGYFRLEPWETSAALGHRHGVPVYASLDEARVKDPMAKALRMTIEAYRGRALAAWRAGVDGVYLFNAFDPSDPLWRELGDPEKLERLDHDYFASIRGVGSVPHRALPHEKYQHVPTLNPASPLTIGSDKPTEVTFDTGIDLAKLSAEKQPIVYLWLQFDRRAAADALRVTLNDQPLSSPQAQGNWLGFRLTAKELKIGANVVRVSLGESETSLEWTDLRCSVRWPE